MESKEHLQLKEKAKQVLIEKGFNDNQMFTEFKFKDNGERVDYVGIKKGLRVAIECGTLSKKTRIKELKEKFDIVLHLPYLGRRTRTIVVSDETWHKLMQQKLKLQAKSLDELINNCLRE